MIAICALIWVVLVVLIILAMNGWVINFIFAAKEAFAVLREEVARPARVIRKALNRRQEIALDEYERHLS